MVAKASPFEIPWFCIEYDGLRGLYMALICGSSFPISLSIDCKDSRPPVCHDRAFSKKLSDFCIFIAKHYVRVWFLARSAVSALCHDIAICKTLEEDNAIIRKVGIRTLARHLWYLSEVTVRMALFD